MRASHAGFGSGSRAPPQPTPPPVPHVPVPPVLGVGMGLGLPMSMDIPIIGDPIQPPPAPAVPKKKPGYLVGWFHLVQVDQVIHHTDGRDAGASSPPICFSMTGRVEFSRLQSQREDLADTLSKLKRDQVDQIQACTAPMPPT